MDAETFFRGHVLVHCHIEKTAGSSLVHAFREWFGERVTDLRRAGTTPPDALAPAARARIWVLSGHFAAHVHDDAFARRVRHVACLREPAERFQSYVRYVQRDPRHPGFRLFDGLSLAEAAAWAVANGHHAATNPMSTALAGVARPLLVPHDRQRALLAHLGRAFARPPLAPRRNVNPDNGALDEEAAAIIRAANGADLALCARARDEFDAWLARPATLEALLEAKPVPPRRRRRDATATPDPVPADSARIPADIARTPPDTAPAPVRGARAPQAPAPAGKPEAGLPR